MEHDTMSRNIGGIKISAGRELLEANLRKMIRNNELDPAKPIPSETAWGEEYHLCRNTVRKVLQTLMDEGLLYKRQGRGTFIISPENRSPEQVRKTKFLVFLPEYQGSASRLPSYDKNLLSGISDFAFQNFGKLELRPDGDSAERLLDQYRNLKFDGIIWERPGQIYNSVIEKLHRHNIPQVTISRSIGEIPSVFFDYRNGFLDVLDFLFRIGHRHIVFLDLPDQAPIFTDRRCFFTETLRKAGIKDPERYAYNISFRDDRCADIDSILAEHSEATAFFCSASLILEFRKKLLQKGYRIPEDFSLVAFGDSQEYLSDCQICSLREPRSKIGWRAAEIIQAIRQNREISAVPEMISGELITRKSCCSPFALLQPRFLSENQRHPGTPQRISL